ncbi:unnamed protein product [Spirodela intermedia]|uniref:Uncharacterized protein n=1 Tax=Spirodela intermedia TaxID=51605 RepID=A0A7I8K7A2_SPIIN|nr:unnamed protein product [Spirodela intermedia]
MGRQIISNGYHPAEQKKGDFATLLLPDREELDGGEACVKELHPQVRATRVGSSSHLVRSQEVATHLPADYPLPDDSFFILRSAQQGEALHHIWYALRRWRLVSRRIVLFPMTACSSINRR